MSAGTSVFSATNKALKTSGKDLRQCDTDAYSICVIGLWRSFSDFALAESVAINVFPVCPSYMKTWMTVPCRIGSLPHLDTAAQENEKSSLPPEWHWDEECSMYKQQLDWSSGLATTFWVKIHLSIYTDQKNTYTSCVFCLKKFAHYSKSHLTWIKKWERGKRGWDIFSGLLLGFITYFFFAALNGIQVFSMIQRTGSRLTQCIRAHEASFTCLLPNLRNQCLGLLQSWWIYYTRHK